MELKLELMESENILEMEAALMELKLELMESENILEMVAEKIPEMVVKK